MEIGKKIKKIASSKDISVKELAKRIGKTTQAIYDLYNERVSISINMLEKIAIALDEPIFNFFIQSPDSYYDLLPEALPMEEVHKVMHSIHEHAKKGQGLVNLSLILSQQGMFMLEYEFHELKDKLNQETIVRFGNKLYESLVISSPTFPGNEKK